MMPTATGRVGYHLRQPHQRIVIDADGQAGRRIDPELDEAEVALHDARHEPPVFVRDGLAFVDAPTRGFREGDAIAYEAELAALLTRVTGAREVVVFDHTVRVDGTTRRPARHVHGDYTARSAHQRLEDILGSERASDWAAGHFAFLNVWRPLGAAVERAPLGFALPSTVPAADWMDIELVYPDRRGQIQGLAHNPAHRWVYLPRMRPDEAAIFNVYDNRGRKPVAHAAVDLLATPEDAPPRKSVESRTIVRF